MNLQTLRENCIDQKYVKVAFDTSWVVTLGPNVSGFEAVLERFVGEIRKWWY